MKNIEQHLLLAIRTMRDYCDSAERKLDRADSTDMDKILNVFHELVWGWANASAQLENAMVDNHINTKLER